jgi:hypothetical protein
MDQRLLSAHVLKTLARAQVSGARSSLETLVEALHVRRKDVRAAVSALDAAGYLDALHMRLTLNGFAIGAALRETNLAPLRSTEIAASRAA